MFNIYLILVLKIKYFFLIFLIIQKFKFESYSNKLKDFYMILIILQIQSKLIDGNKIL